jgi:hypothetical protein
MPRTKNSSKSNRINFKKLVGKIVGVRFLDHALGESSCECVLFGMVFENTKKEIKIRYWHCLGMADDDPNHEHAMTIKSTVLAVKVFR